VKYIKTYESDIIERFRKKFKYKESDYVLADNDISKIEEIDFGRAGENLIRIHVFRLG